MSTYFCRSPERIPRSKSHSFSESNQDLGLKGRYTPTEKVVVYLEAEKKERKEKFQYAVREFGRTILGSKLNRDKVPREEKVSIDLGNKIVIDHYNGLLLNSPTMSEEPAYMREVGTKERKSYIGYETIAKRFSLEEQEKNTKIIKRDEKGEYRLFNQNGNLYDTSKEVSKDVQGFTAYAITLDGKLVTSQHIRPGEDVKYGHYHSTLLGGQPGLCFGMMKVKDGKITDINTFSGHYKPKQENLYNAVFHRSELEKVLSDDTQITTKSTLYNKKKNKIEDMQHVENPKQFSQRMETKGKDDLTMPERYFKGLNEYNEMYKNKLNDSKSSYTEKILEERQNTANLSK